MKINPTIFKAYDIRGKYPEELDETTAERIGNATAVFLSKKYKKKKLKFLLMRDLRASSPALRDAVARGVMAQGSDVLDGGKGTTPYFYFVLEKVKADGGIMITASHNPAIFNGVKIRGRKEGAIYLGMGLKKIRDIVMQKKQTYAPNQGEIILIKNFYDEYIKFLSRRINIGPLRIIVDAAGGATLLLLPTLLNKFSKLVYKPLFFKSDPTFKNHSPNPLDPKAQKLLRDQMKNGGFRFSVIFDGDGDRVVFLDETGKKVPTEFIGGLLAIEELKKNKKGVFVFPINVSKGVREVLEETGGKIILSKIGYSFVAEIMNKHNADLATEVSGHFYFKNPSGFPIPIQSTLLAMLRVAELLSRSPYPMSQLVKPMARYFSSGEVNFHVENKEKILVKLKNFYRQGKISTLDGIIIEFNDWWFNLRPSNTEPVVRLVLEAKTQKLFDEKMEELKQLIRG